MGSSGADYYAILGVEPGATLDQLRAAYHKLALRFHPDRNSTDDAQRQFQSVSEAYATLSNAGSRRAYDRALIQRGGSGRTLRSKPVCCSECGRVTAQPRILSFRKVTSYLVWSTVKSTEGIFCARCGRRAGLKASVSSALLGWWSPIGPLVTPYIILSNAFGGQRQPHADQKLLVVNAEAFLAAKEARLAYALARQVRKTGDMALGQRALRTMLEAKALDEGLEFSKLRDPWKVHLGYILAQAAMAFGGPGALGLAIALLR